MAYYVVSDDNLPLGVGRPGPPLNFCPWPMFRESLRRTGDENPQHKGSPFWIVRMVILEIQWDTYFCYNIYRTCTCTYRHTTLANLWIVSLYMIYTQCIYMHHWSSHPMIQSKPSQLTFFFFCSGGFVAPAHPCTSADSGYRRRGTCERFVGGSTHGQGRLGALVSGIAWVVLHHMHTEITDIYSTNLKPVLCIGSWQILVLESHT